MQPVVDVDDSLFLSLLTSIFFSSYVYDIERTREAYASENNVCAGRERERESEKNARLAAWNPECASSSVAFFSLDGVLVYGGG